uniref:Uncharacterized protein n=1 Tax=Physcomitrium patens TaxID=3218 RepID=A0A7I3ZNP3_PHYPA
MHTHTYSLSTPRGLNPVLPVPLVYHQLVLLLFLGFCVSPLRTQHPLTASWVEKSRSVREDSSARRGDWKPW